MERIRVEWTGLTGLPGVSTFYADPSVPTAYAAVHDFFNSIRSFFPSTLNFVFPANGDLIEDTTGALAGTWSTTQQASLPGQGATTTHAAGVGCRVRWNTNGVSSSNRRVRGATFLTALSTTYYEADGTIENSTRAAIEAAANTMAGAASFRIWSRPTGGAGGSSFLVTSATVPDRVTSLRSRRL